MSKSRLAVPAVPLGFEFPSVGINQSLCGNAQNVSLLEPGQFRCHRPHGGNDNNSALVINFNAVTARHAIQKVNRFLRKSEALTAIGRIVRASKSVDAAGVAPCRYERSRGPFLNAGAIPLVSRAFSISEFSSAPMSTVALVRYSQSSSIAAGATRP